MPANNSVVGLDIGTANLRAVQVLMRNGTPLIEKAAVLPLEPNIIVAGQVEEPAALTAAIKTLWKNGGFTSDDVRLAIGGDRVISRLAPLEWAPDKDLSRILPFAAEEVLPIEVKDYYLDYHTLSEYTVKELDPNDDEEYIFSKKKFVLIAGAEKKLVQQHVDAVLAAKLRPTSVDIQSLAMLRAYDRPQAPDDLADISIDLGADNMTIVIHKLGQPLYIRTISDVGGRTITEAIQEEFSQHNFRITFDKAERRKLRALYGSSVEEQEIARTVFDLPEEEETDEQSSPLDAHAERERMDIARDIISRHMGGIMLNIRETIDGFLGSGQYSDLNSFAPFVLSGGVSGTPHLAERLTSEFGFEVGLANPISARDHKEISDSLMEREHEFVTAVGLAIGQGASHE